MDVEQSINDYAALLGTIQDRVGDGHVALVVLEQISKDRRMAQIVNERNGNAKHDLSGMNGDQPATVKQIGYLRKLGVKKIDPKLTKKQASTMIDELAGQNGY